MREVGRAVCHGRVAAGDDHVLGAVGGGCGHWNWSRSSRWCCRSLLSSRGLHLDLTVTDLIDWCHGGGQDSRAGREGSEGE